MKEYLKSREFVSVALVSTQVNEEIIQKLKQFFCKIELDVYPTTDFVFSADALWNFKKNKKQNKSKKKLSPQNSALCHGMFTSKSKKQKQILLGGYSCSPTKK